MATWHSPKNGHGRAALRASRIFLAKRQRTLETARLTTTERRRSSLLPVSAKDPPPAHTPTTPRTTSCPARTQRLAAMTSAPHDPRTGYLYQPLRAKPTQHCPGICADAFWPRKEPCDDTLTNPTAGQPAGFLPTDKRPECKSAADGLQLHGVLLDGERKIRPTPGPPRLAGQLPANAQDLDPSATRRPRHDLLWEASRRSSPEKAG
jgi:hypothetical protein